MELTKCRNGHSYDPSISPVCPECAGHTVPLDGPGFYGAEEIGKTVPIRRDTQPVNSSGGHWAEEPGFATGGTAPEDYNATMPFNYDKSNSNSKAQQPVTGWLVCLEGPEKGSDFRIHEEYNYIGRSSSMDICIPGDPTISREQHAIIAYDTQEKAFYFSPFSGASIVRLNGKAVLSNTQLKAGDKLQIGKCVFLFVPLCGEDFQWN